MIRFFPKFFYLLLIIFLSFSELAICNDDIFYIENISSSASANSAKDAKIISLNKARREAFSSLLSRLKANQNILNISSDEQIFDAIISEQISDEKIAGNSYSANFNILFSREIASKIIKNLSSQKIQNSNYLLVAVLVKNSEKNIIWQQENFWQNLLKKNIEEKKITNLIFAENDISNISIVNESNLANISFNDLETLFVRYKLKGIHIIYFDQNNAENKTLVRIETFQNYQKKITAINFVNGSQYTEASLNNKIASKIIKFIIDNQANFISEDRSKIEAEIKINSLEEMSLIKNKIEKSGFISNFLVKSISKDYFKAEISIIPNIQIEESFSAIGLKIEKKSQQDNYLIYQN
jgi:hypothetical protein